jgi:hypothetical protein
MEKSENLSVPVIAGYTKAQVLFTIDEITKKTDHISLQIMLYRNFGLYDHQADDLIQKVKNETGLVLTVYETSLTGDMSHLLVKNKDSDATYQVTAGNSGGNSFDIIIGILILGVGLVITCSGSGVIAYGAIIVGAARIIGGLTSNNE